MIFTGLFSLPSIVAWSQEVQYHSSIFVEEMYEKHVKNSACVFSDGNSEVVSSTLNTDVSGTNHKSTKELKRRGKTYLSREVDWSSRADEKSLILNFHADNASFNDDEIYDDHTCSYKYWQGSAVAAQNQLKATAAFLVPKGVWTIRIKSLVQSSPGSLTVLNMSNEDCAKDSLDCSKLEKKRLPTFEYNGESYFIVNASSEKYENFLYLDVDHIKNSLSEDDLQLSFKVDFIAAEDCLDKFYETDSLTQIVNYLKTENIDQVIVGLSCMLNATYVAHTLSFVQIYGTNHFFEEIFNLEKYVQNGQSLQNQDQGVYAKFGVVEALLDRIHVYYSYEILKDIYGMLSASVDVDGKKIDSLFYIDVIERKGVLHINNYLNDLEANLNKLLQVNSSVFEIVPDLKLQSDIFVNNILPVEFKYFVSMHEKMIRPNFVSQHYYAEVDRSVQNIWKKSQNFLELNTMLLKQPKVTKVSIEKSIYLIKELYSSLQDYSSSFARLKETYLEDEETAPQNFKEKRKRLLAQLRLILDVNLESMLNLVGNYYKHNFEDPIFSSKKINGIEYQSVDDFVRDFRRFLKTWEE